MVADEKNHALMDYIDINRATMDNHTNVIFIKDTNFRFLYVNKAYLEYKQLPKEMILGERNEDIEEEEQAKKFRKTDLKVLNTGKTLEFEAKVGRPLHHQNHYLISKAPIFDKEGNIIGILGSASKIDEFIKTRKDLEINLNLIETLMDTIPYPIFVKDLDGVYIKVNAAYLQEIDLSEDEVIGKDDTELFGSETGQLYIDKDQAVIESGDRIVYMSTNPDNGNSYLTTKDVLRDKNGKIIGIVGIVNPYVDMSDLQDDIINYQRIESISQLAGGITHDLNNLLTNIVGLSSILQLDEDDQTRKKELRVIYNAGKQASQLIDKLRTFSQNTQVEHVTLDINKLIDDVVTLISTNYGKNLQIVSDTHDDKLLVHGNQTQLSQLVMNLMINGIEAMDATGILTVKTRPIKMTDKTESFLIQPSELIPSEYAQLTVSDEGIGIAPMKLNRIFEPYYTSKKTGSGLGLSIVYGVVMSHNGLLRIDTKLGHGTTFDIRFPLQ